MTSVGHFQQKALVSRIEAKLWVLNIFPVLSGQLVSHLEKVRIQWKRQARRCNNTVCSDHTPMLTNVSLWIPMIRKKHLHKKYVAFHKKTNRCTHRTNLPFKWTVMSSNKHALSRQQGVVTPPRPLVQSARLLPARLGTAEWRMEGWRSCGSGGRRWAWISDRLRDVKMEGKIRGQRDRKQEKQTEKNEKRGRECVRGRQRRKGAEDWLFHRWFWMQKWHLTP